LEVRPLEQRISTLMVAHHVNAAVYGTVRRALARMILEPRTVVLAHFLKQLEALVCSADGHHQKGVVGAGSLSPPDLLAEDLHAALGLPGAGTPRVIPVTATRRQCAPSGLEARDNRARAVPVPWLE